MMRNLATVAVYILLWAPLMEGLAGTGLALEQSGRIPYNDLILLNVSLDRL